MQTLTPSPVVAIVCLIDIVANVVSVAAAAVDVVIEAVAAARATVLHERLIIVAVVVAVGG